MKYDIETEQMDHESVKMQRAIANELAEQNRLKKIELELKIIEMSATVSMDIDPSLGKENARRYGTEVNQKSVI